ncbi:hypothetical protein Cgig2_032633 [Carnegiea gigantea]|uniref:Peptidase A1 domain-containing protein n=1 Tax=Carnegiea gigantea TaxID=171969 RepID=A0A9Q1KY56_9CARY|nr:hypothetical protein Cgig2_032633 [Carnegiea gigantea]
MVLRMGSDVKVIPGMKTTPMPSVPEGPHTAYYLNLEGISVAKKRLNIPPDVFKVKGDHSGGCVIDTGTSVTLLVTEAFQVFEQELTKYVLRRNKDLKRIVPELGYEICFERIAPPTKVRLPWVKFHFENNADFIIKYEGAFYIGFTQADKPMVCSTIVKSTEKYRKITLLGGEQQVNHQIIYDTVNQQLMVHPWFARTYSIVQMNSEYHWMTLIEAIQQGNHRITFDTKNEKLRLCEEDRAQGTGKIEIKWKRHHIIIIPSSLHPNDVIFRAEMSLQDWLCIVKLGLGKFHSSSNSFQFQTIYLALDTGSDVSWT